MLRTREKHTFISIKTFEEKLIKKLHDQLIYNLINVTLNC